MRMGYALAQALTLAIYGAGSASEYSELLSSSILLASSELAAVLFSSRKRAGRKAWMAAQQFSGDSIWEPAGEAMTGALLMICFL